MGEVAVPIPGDGRVARPRQGVRDAPAAVTRAQTPLGIEGVAPAPKEREGPQAVRPLHSPHPTNVVPAPGVVRGVGQPPVAPQAKVVPLRTTTVAHAEAAAHLLGPLHGEGLAPGGRIQGAGRAPLVTELAAPRSSVAAGVARPLPVPDPSAFQAAPLDPQGHTPSRHAGPEAGTKGPPLERRLRERGVVRPPVALHPGDAGAKARPVADEARAARPVSRARKAPSPCRAAAPAATSLPRPAPEGEAVPRPVRRVEAVTIPVTSGRVPGMAGAVGALPRQGVTLRPHQVVRLKAPRQVLLSIPWRRMGGRARPDPVAARYPT